MGWKDGIIGSIIDRNTDRLRLEAGREVKSGIMGGLGILTGGLLGNRNAGQDPSTIVDRNGVSARPTGIPGARIPQQVGGAQERSGLGAILGNIADAFSRNFLPGPRVTGQIDRAVGAVGAAASGAVVAGQQAVQGATDAARRAVIGSENPNAHNVPVEDRVAVPVSQILAKASPESVVVTPVPDPSIVTIGTIAPSSTAPQTAITTNIDAGAAFSSVAAPAESPPILAQPEQAPAETASRFDAETNARARAQVAAWTSGGPGGGPN